MGRIPVLVCILFSGFAVNAQELTLNDLSRLLNMNTADVNDLLLHKDYKLSYNDSSAAGINRYYESYVKKENSVQVRSFSYSLARVNGYEGILILYRTYDKKEQEGFIDYIRENGYTLSDNYKIDNAESFVYKKGPLSIRCIITMNETADGKKIASYAVELGR